jgi:hypothetical protein
MKAVATVWMSACRLPQRRYLRFSFVSLVMMGKSLSMIIYLLDAKIKTLSVDGQGANG